MQGETDLARLLRNISPRLNEGEYVFATVSNPEKIERGSAILEFREDEGTTVIIEKAKADQLQLRYTFEAAWITLVVHSSLDAVGLTAAFSKALADENISCNVVAGYYHDHIFVNKNEKEKALAVLKAMSKNAVNGE